MTTWETLMSFPYLVGFTMTYNIAELVIKLKMGVLKDLAISNQVHKARLYCNIIEKNIVITS